jgi:hypothetical protein
MLNTEYILIWFLSLERNLDSRRSKGNDKNELFRIFRLRISILWTLNKSINRTWCTIEIKYTYRNRIRSKLWHGWTIDEEVDRRISRSKSTTRMKHVSLKSVVLILLSHIIGIKPRGIEKQLIDWIAILVSSGQTMSVDEVKWHKTEALCKYIHNQSCTNILVASLCLSHAHTAYISVNDTWWKSNSYLDWKSFSCLSNCTINICCFVYKCNSEQILDWTWSPYRYVFLVFVRWRTSSYNLTSNKHDWSCWDIHLYPS